MTRLQRIELKSRQTLEIIAQVHGVSLREIRSDDRHAAVVRARHACCYALRQQWGLSTPDIGKLLGGKHHTSVMYGIRKVGATQKPLQIVKGAA